MIEKKRKLQIMADAVVGASGEAGGPARSDAGEGSEGQRAEVLAGKLRQIEEEIKIAIDHDTYGDNEMCMHGLYFDGRCGFCHRCNEMGCIGDREKHDQIKRGLQFQPKKRSLCERLRRLWCSC